MAATETVTLRLVAQDLMSGNVSKAIGSIDKLARQGGLVGSVMQGVGQSFGQLLNPVALVANGIGMVTDALGDSLTAFREDEQSQTKLRAALEANIEAWDGNTDAIEGVIASRMKLGFSDDEQRQSLALMVAQIGDVDDALAAQRAAMDLARLKSISLADAGTVLARAYLGSTTALQKMGIKLAKGTDGMEAIAAVQERAAGQAEAWADTSAGAAEVFNIKVGELQESLGRLVDGPARDFIGFLGDVIDRLAPSGASSLPPRLQTLIDKMNALDTATAQVADNGPQKLVMTLEQAQMALDGLSETATQMAAGSGSTGPLAALFDVRHLGPQFIQLADAVGVTAQDFFNLALAADKNNLSFEEFRSNAFALVNGTDSTVTSIVDSWTLGMKQVGTAVEDGADDIGVTFTEAQLNVGRLAKGVAWNITYGLADEVRGGIKDVKSAMHDLTWAINHPLALQKDRNKILGALMGKKLRDGINSSNPLVRQVAIETRQTLLTQWNALPSKAMELGRLTIKQLMKGLSEGEQYALGVYGSTGTSNQPGDNAGGGGGGGRGGKGGKGKGGRGNNNREAPAQVTVVHIGSLSERDGADLARTIDTHLERHRGRRGQ